MKPLPYTRPRLAQAFRSGGWFSPALILALLGLEFLGRQTSSDLNDTLGGTALLVLALIVVARHKSAPLQWVSALGRFGSRVLNWFSRYKIDLGLDLRGTPPIPRRAPRAIVLTIAGLTAWTAAMFAVWHFFPQGWRTGLVSFSYLLYLAFVTVFWGLLFVGALGGVFLPILLLTRLFPRTLAKNGSPRMNRSQMAVLLAYVGAILLANWLLPLWVVPVLCGVALFALLAARFVPVRAGVQFIWRPHGTRRVYSVPARQLFISTTSIFVLVLLTLSVTACGGVMLGLAPDAGVPAGILGGGFGRALIAPPQTAEATMPVTILLGTWLAWLTPGILVSAGIWGFLAWRRNPSRPCKPVVHVSGETVPAVRSRVSRIFRNWGWQVRFEPNAPLKTDVCIRLVEPAQSDAREFDPGWPLRLSLEDLQEGSVRSRLERRYEIQCRRLLLKGLEKLMKHTKDRTFGGGSGFWLAPHLWLLHGMTRDDIEENDNNDEPNILMRSVGPPYHRVFPRAARHYLYNLLRALEVDLLFVEDGIDHRKLNKVMRVLFEVFDKFAGQRRAEEIQFQGLPKVKVMIHDFQMDQPFESSTYPEPRFEDLGRARILHIFRDRGDQEELVEPPFDSSRTPAPMWMN